MTMTPVPTVDLDTEIPEAVFESMCEAFADAPGRKADASLSGVDSAREVPYAVIPEGSKDWYRQRMYAAMAVLGIEVVPSP